MTVPHHQLFRALLRSPVFATAPQGNAARLMHPLLGVISGYD